MNVDHVAEELLESYALDRLEDAAVITAVEEHLLVCHWCQNRLEQIDALRAALRQGIFNVDADT